MELNRITARTNSVSVTNKRIAKRDKVTDSPGDVVSIGDSPSKESKLWTIMHYSAADNNLHYFLKKDVNEMEKVGSTDLMNVVVKLDEGDDNCRTYYLSKDGDPDKINSPVIADHGSTNMSDPKVLAQFIKSTVEKYPAEHYALIISDHGSAWEGAVQDASHKGWMSTPDIGRGIRLSGKKIDVLGFDACMMASTEVAHEVAQAGVGYMVASQETEGGDGWPYTPLLTPRKMQMLDRALRTKLDVTPDEFAKKIVETSCEDQKTLPTMSAVDLSQMKELSDATNLFAGQILSTETPVKILKEIARKTLSFNFFKDQYHFAQQVAGDERITDNELKKGARAMMDSINKAVIAEQHSDEFPDAHGLTAEIPSFGGLDVRYGKLSYAKQTLWDEAIKKIAR